MIIFMMRMMRLMFCTSLVCKCVCVCMFNYDTHTKIDFITSLPSVNTRVLQTHTRSRPNITGHVMTYTRDTHTGSTSIIYQIG